MSGHWHTLWDESTRVVWLGLDVADRALNVLSAEVLDALEQRLDEIRGALADKSWSLAIHSLKESGFIAGADLGEFDSLADVDQGARQIRRVHALLDRIESLPCPTLALIHGICLGGGLELALACRYRIASDDPATRIGFPEVRLGIFPGYGGTWRALRILGPVPAMGLMLTGRQVRAREAERLGLIDRVVPRRQLEAAALDLLREAPRPRHAPASQRLLNRWPLRQAMAARMRREAALKVRPEHYPAPFALIDHWRASGGDRSRLLESEARRVPELLLGETSRNLRRVFQLQERLKGLARPGSDPWRPRHVHVVGAGVMGGDIAAWAARSGLRVTLQDLSLEQLGRTVARAQGLFQEQLRDPRLVRAACDRLIPDPRGDGLRRADLVIEAIVEDLEAKQRLFAELERAAGPETLLATNTSSIPLEAIGAGMARPERLIGLHFFNPVVRMQLVEVVHGPTTEPRMVARGLAAVRALDRLPLPVQSRPGFLVNRVLMPYLLEAVDLLEEGVAAAHIDRAAVDFGMPMGPLALADSVGLDICLAVAEKLGAALTAPEETPARLRRLVESRHLGRKSGQGFYRYRRGQALPEPIPRGAGPPRTSRSA
jgi:3-hydroxyacyl-CoA dehydrogenase/enoyl-CoA hydratase/3-hydroxybutyryl-CoA epimerase